jgi:hypothetical protein
MVQPDKYMETASHPALRTSGALARIWAVWLPTMVGSRIESENEAGLSDDAMRPYNELLRRILAMSESPKRMRKENPGTSLTSPVCPLLPPGRDVSSTMKWRGQWRKAKTLKT